ncbi:hypothetical protein ARMSODRAFT_1026777 [Armillaria solidipes]|uniref:Uncharacterized protein n=1 Tax=Armillaria solidipes TaxID=1076256 RepID=A0A2H3B2N2_9AGAR|nr:hypothetical protein ARMSODRAFT_1026777 [Armillaria solidipes]
MSSNSAMTSSDQVQPQTAINLLPDELLLEIFAFGTRCSKYGRTFPFLIATVCRSWRLLAINEARLWTSPTVIPSTDVPALPSDGPSDPVTIFPREALILERSGDRDLDFEIPHVYHRSESFTDGHFTVLSSLLAEHAYRIRSFKVVAKNWPEIRCLCEDLGLADMPRLQTWNVVSDTDLAFKDVYDDDEPDTMSSILVLAYAFDFTSLPIPIQDLQESSSLLYPALADVTVSGVPTSWGMFSASNLRKLCLANHPWRNRLTMETLHGILCNSQDTLETLELRWIIVAEEDSDTWTVDIGYSYPEEACHVLQTFDFPALHELRLPADGREFDSSVFVDVMKYLPVENLDDLSLIRICVPPGEFPHPDLVRDGSITEGSLPLLLQFIRCLGLLQKLSISLYPDTFLKFMNYRKGDTINMAKLKGLWMQEHTEDSNVGIVPFLRERLELGTVDGEYVGPVLEDMTLVIRSRVYDEVKKYFGLSKSTLPLLYKCFPSYFGFQDCSYVT